MAYCCVYERRPVSNVSKIDHEIASLIIIQHKSYAVLHVGILHIEIITHNSMCSPRMTSYKLCSTCTQIVTLCH